MQSSIRSAWRLASGISCVVAASAGAQFTLRDAFREADRSGYATRIAAAQSATQRAQAIAPLKGILPSVRLEGGYARTTDPVGSFGTTLRQGSITQGNFDPQRLNHPDAIGNYQGGLVVEQPIFNADAWAGRSAATHAADASAATEDWTRISARVDVVRAYYGAVLASERVTTLQTAARAAHAHVDQAEAMVKQGLATKSDALLAAVRAGDVDAQLAEAEGAAAMARQQLAVVLGRGAGAQVADLILPRRLPLAREIRAIVSADTAAASPQQRSDLLAASEGLVAARDDARRARAALLPRINAFARSDWNSGTRPYAGQRNWTVGVMASWSPFAGAGERSDVEASSGRAAAAQAQADASRAKAQLDVEQTRTALVVALKRLEIADRALAQSAEAHRIVTRKYDGGLATVSELLDAQAAETQSGLALAQARWQSIVAGADRRRALGLDPATLAAFDETATLAAGGADNLSSLTNPNIP